MKRLRTLALGTVSTALFLATAVTAVELPEAPAGFAWQTVEAVRASFLVPAGWHLQSSREEGGAEILITEHAASDEGVYETGVSVEVFLDDPNGPQKLRRVMEQIGAQHSAQLTPSTTGPFAMLTLQFESTRPGEPTPYRLFSLGIANLETKTAYLITFRTPTKRWNETWPKGQRIVTTVALDAEL